MVRWHKTKFLSQKLGWIIIVLKFEKKKVGKIKNNDKEKILNICPQEK